jgi:plasmid stabilization system protein ParE
MAQRLVLQQAAAFWYENQLTGLGIRFLDELDEVFRHIENNPRQFPTLEREARRALLRHFPYGVYFAEGADEVVVLAVLHLHREPDMWKSRN